jgi:hypothetical protein
VNIQVVHHQPNTFGLGEVDIDQFFHARRKVQFGAALGDDDMSPARQGLQVGKQIARAECVNRLWTPELRI